MSERVDPSDVRNEQEAPRSLELTWDDLIWVSQQSLGLRNLSSKKAAEQEFIHGVNGDALALSAINPGIPEYLGISHHPIFTDIERAGIPEADRERVLAGFRTAVVEHIQRGIRDRLGRTEESTVDNFLHEAEECPAVIIADFGTAAKYGLSDKRHYGGLGKVGGSNRGPEQIYGVIYPPERDTISRGLSSEELQSKPTADTALNIVPQKLGERYWQQVVSLIKSRPQAGARIQKFA